MFRKITAAYDDPDPFRRRKDSQNEKCLELYPWLKSLVAESEDPLFTAVNLAIAGNSIDPMGYLSSEEVEQAIRGSLEHPVCRNRFSDLKDRLEKSSLVIYLGDNCGEIVFDKLLIETIKAHYDIDVAFVVRSIPALNDATLREAELVGMDRYGYGNGKRHRWSITGDSPVKVFGTTAKFCGLVPTWSSRREEEISTVSTKKRTLLLRSTTCSCANVFLINTILAFP